MLHLVIPISQRRRFDTARPIECHFSIITEIEQQQPVDSTMKKVAYISKNGPEMEDILFVVAPSRGVIWRWALLGVHRRVCHRRSVHSWREPTLVVCCLLLWEALGWFLLVLSCLLL